MKSASVTQVVKSLDEFMRILNTILKKVYDDKITIEIERTGHLVVTSKMLNKKIILENWTCLGSFNPCTIRLYKSLENSLGQNVLNKIFEEFDEWLRKKYSVKANIRGLVIYPFSVKIIIGDETVEYKALMGKDVFRTKTILRKQIKE